MPPFFILQSVTELLDMETTIDHNGLTYLLYLFSLSSFSYQSVELETNHEHLANGKEQPKKGKNERAVQKPLSKKTYSMSHQFPICK